MAPYQNDIKAVELLLTSRADSNVQNCYGQTALHAAHIDHIEIAKLLLKHRADPRIQSCYGKTFFSDFLDVEMY